MSLTLTLVVARGGLVPCSIRFLVACPRSIPPRTAATRSAWLSTRRVLGAVASRAKAEASVVGTTARSFSLFARRILDAPASEVKAEAVVGVLVPAGGLFTRRTWDAYATEVKAEAPAVRTFVRAKFLFA